MQNTFRDTEYKISKLILPFALHFYIPNHENLQHRQWNLRRKLKLKVNVTTKIALYNVCDYIISHTCNNCLLILFSFILGFTKITIVDIHLSAEVTVPACVSVLSIRGTIYPIHKQVGINNFSIRGFIYHIQKQVCINISSRFLPNIYHEGHQTLCCNYIVIHSKYYTMYITPAGNYVHEIVLSVNEKNKPPLLYATNTFPSGTIM
jgi:hypothetical protein